MGYATSDDAAVYLLGKAGDPDAETLLSTVDFFTPIVESPFDFGRIAAANALSDIYAMGGEPLFALNVVGFPTKKLPLSVLREILRGGAETAREAGMSIVGGHSVDYDVPVYGMAVTGRAVVSRVRRNVGAHAGDALVLTKAIGTGVITAALRARALAARSAIGLFSKGPHVAAEEEAAAVAGMARLNRAAARAADDLAVSACTDVTGFGLLGHLRQMLSESGVAAELVASSVPVLPGARRLAGEGSAPEGSFKNLQALEGSLEAPGVAKHDLLLLADAQTSGGLLFALPEPAACRLLQALRAAGEGDATVIGHVLEGPAGRIVVRP